MKTLRGIVVTFIGLIAWQVSTASLIGTSISGNVNNATYAFSSNSAIVGAGIEFQSILTNVTTAVDFSADTLTLSYENTSNFPNITYSALTYTFSDLDWHGTSGGILGLNEISNDFPSIINTSFTYDSITLDVSLTNTNPGDIFVATYQIIGETASVPEPSILALMGIGLAGLGFARRRKTKN